MKTLSSILFLFLFAVVAGSLPTSATAATPPSILNYQGRVSVNGLNFDGPGLFRFALVDAGGTTTYWSNDGTSSGGSQPTAAVPVAVTKGLYSVHLGDTALMGAIPASVFADNSAVYLRVWFDDGSNGVQQLSNDQRIVAAAYAVQAGGLHVEKDGTAPLAVINNTEDEAASLSFGTDARTWRIGQNQPPDAPGGPGYDLFFIYDQDANATRLAIEPGGEVGIGTTAPAAKLDVAGAVKLATNAATETAGMVRWTGSDFEGYDGTEWKSLTMAAAAPGAVSIEMVPVGNAGNAADTTGDPNPAGAVAYQYQIGKYKVTNAQYAAFLNAVAATDTNALYSANMGSNARGGITRVGASPNLTYSVKVAMGDKPVNYVSWYDCLRFCNWLHNGQPTGPQGAGTTEGGAYTLTGPLSVGPGTDPTHGANGRNAGALFHLPSENEWYKAAYHEPGASGNSYWLYPTRSDGAPTVATADGVGSIDNDVPNIANYLSGADWNGENGNVTTVGSGGPGSQSFYGAADMGGNVWEWNEQDIGGGRGLRGGAWDSFVFDLQSSGRFDVSPSFESDFLGFRVAGPQ